MLIKLSLNLLVLDADYFHKLSKDAEQLKQGLRCGETINTLCKEIIKPIWDHYGYERVWKPAKNIIGTSLYLPSLLQTVQLWRLY